MGISLKNIIKYWPAFLVLGLSCTVTLAAAEEECAIPDLTSDKLASINRELGCPSAQDTANKVGCAILAEFVAAGKPDPRILTDSPTLDGRRWLGVSVVTGPPSLYRGELDQQTPYLNLAVLGARYGDKRKEKPWWYQNGISVVYILPGDREEARQIEQASAAFIMGKMDSTNKMVQSADSSFVDFRSVCPSEGTSLATGNGNLLVRQRGSMLYLIEMGSNKDGVPKNWISRISLRHQISSTDHVHFGISGPT